MGKTTAWKRQHTGRRGTFLGEVAVWKRCCTGRSEKRRRGNADAQGREGTFLGGREGDGRERKGGSKGDGTAICKSNGIITPIKIIMHSGYRKYTCTTSCCFTCIYFAYYINEDFFHIFNSFLGDKKNLYMTLYNTDFYLFL